LDPGAKQRAGIRIAWNADNDVHVVCHDRYGKQLPVTVLGGCLNLAADCGGLLTIEFDRSKLLSGLRVALQMGMVAVVFRAGSVVRGLCAGLIADCADEASFVARQPVAVRGPSEEPAAVHGMQSSVQS
jgi:hypothetical protein